MNVIEALAAIAANRASKYLRSFALAWTVCDANAVQGGAPIIHRFGCLRPKGSLMLAGCAQRRNQSQFGGAPSSLFLKPGVGAYAH